ncbi:MAG: glutathione S-transferase N-terminal domain-containing protein, partial [Acidobacteriota bacterium]|nr:glutathione S-transferase N-terminal domain-containing protein [Acidobacteriota bacterium]
EPGLRLRAEDGEGIHALSLAPNVCLAPTRHGNDRGVELYQAEWCPHSHRVRQRLTELGLDVTLRQVPAEREDRDEMERATGRREIPTLVTDDGDALTGEEEILPWLGRFQERPDAGRHRAKARAEVPEFEEVAG